MRDNPTLLIPSITPKGACVDGSQLQANGCYQMNYSGPVVITGKVPEAIRLTASGPIEVEGDLPDRVMLGAVGKIVIIGRVANNCDLRVEK